MPPKKEIAPSGQERARNERSLELPSHLPENTSAGVGTLKAISLDRLAFSLAGCRGFKGPVPPPLWIRAPLGAIKLSGG
jgi:hypothetical protein